MGRLFDAVSALIGVRQTASYEGQAAIELENICEPEESSFYEIPFSQNEILIQPILEQIVNDLYQRVSVSIISSRFHNGLARGTTEICKQIRTETSISTVAFSGGVWQNRTLLSKTLALIRQAGFTPLIHRQVPTNDGGISLGQVMIANQVLNN
jgi:hydrogenase maturation protein HypF